MKQEIINEIRNLHKEGVSYEKIAKKLNISVTSVIYNLNEKNRKRIINYNVNYFRNLPKEKKKEIYRRRKERIINFLNKKYKTNKAFREERKKYSKKYYRIKALKKEV